MIDVSKLQHARTLRILLALAALSGVYGPLGTIGSTIYTGYALYLGLAPPQIAFLSTIIAVAGTGFLVSHAITSRIRRQKAYLVASGCLEVTLGCLPPLIPLLIHDTGARFAALGSIVLAVSLLANLRGPLHTSWHSLFLPEDIRARFGSRQSIIATVTGMGMGFLAGQWVDRTGKGYASFAVPYVAALAIGLTIYLLQLRIPFPAELKVGERRPIGSALLAPLRDRPFRFFLLFNLSLALGDNIFGPFSGVFFLQEIRETYSYIALLGVITSPLAIASFWLWGNIVQRYGGKPILRLTLAFRVVAEVMLLFLTPANYSWLHTVTALVTSFFGPGLAIAVMTTQYSVMPESGERSAYFATWSLAHSALAVGVTALAAAVSQRIAGFSLPVGGLSFSYLKLFLAAKTSLVALSYLLLRQVAVSQPRERLTLWQLFVGNPISFAYNTMLLGIARSGSLKAKVVRALGQSRSPFAVATLVKAMDDADPDVRAQAVHGLGDSGAEAAVGPLARRLVDARSELRAEAASSLGRIRHATGAEPLFQALTDTDSRVALSAIRALADIGGPQVRDRLHEAFRATGDRTLIPAYVDSLGRLGDVRIIAPALDAMREFSAPVVRLQLLNAVCHALGAGSAFYQMLGLDDLALVQRLDRMQRVRRRILPRLPPVKRFLALECLEIFSESLERGCYDALPDAAYVLGETLLGRGHPGVVALCRFAELHREGASERPELFTLVCLERILG